MSAAKKKRPGIYGCIGVTMLNHPKSVKAGEAMLTWVYAILYSRQHELDGFIPTEAIELLPKPANKLEHAERLASDDVGLFKSVDGGWLILKYVEWNETKREISSRRRAAADATKRWRDKSTRAPGDDVVMPHVIITPDITNTFVPVSNSVFKISEEGVQGEAPPASEVRAGFLGVEEQWYRDGVGAATGRPVTGLQPFARKALSDAVRAHFGHMPATEAEVAVRASSRDYAASLRKGGQVHVSGYAGWLDAGNYRPPSPPPAPAPPPRELTAEEQAERKVVAEHIARDLPELLARMSENATPSILRSVDAANATGADVRWSPKGKAS